MRWYPVRVFTCLGLLAMIAGCGGGGAASSTLPATQPPASSGSEAVSVSSTGVITGFGSVFVNGVEYATGTATVNTSQAQHVGASRLAVGMLVTVDGTINSDNVTGDAQTIHYGNYMIGPIDSVDPTTNSFMMMDHTILVDDLTAMNGTGFNDLAAGQIVEVSGLDDDSGQMHATLVNLDNNATSFTTYGPVGTLDASNMTFMLGQLPVDYQGATHLPATPLTDGMMVTISGNIDNTGQFIADSIQTRSRTPLSAGEHMIIDGVVDSIDSARRFQVDGQWCLINDTTRFAAGMTSQDIAPKVRLRLAGIIDDQGNLVVDQAAMHQQTNFSMTGRISQIGAGMQSVTVNGITCQADGTTLYMDGQMHMHQFGFNSLATGDTVQVRGVRLQDGSCLAQAIDRQAPLDGSTVTFGGQVTSVDATTSSLEVYGKKVQLSDTTLVHLYHGATMSLSDFWNKISVGDRVIVVGTDDGSTMTATDIALRMPHTMMGG